MAWTSRQQDAIDSRNETLLVSAAAGSGKTSVLVERVLGLILKDHISLENMLIVTFTNAAASEMKEKIQKRIRRELKGGGLAQDEAAFLRHQLSVMGSCNISTFHSFAIEVIRRYYYVIGVQPDLAVSDESRTAIFMEEAMDEMFEDRFASEDPDLKYFLDCYATSKKDDQAKEMILEFRRFLQSLPDPKKWSDDLCSGALLDVDAFAAMALEKAEKALRDGCLLLERAGAVLTEGPLEAGLVPAVQTAQKNAADIVMLRGLEEELSSDPSSLSDVIARMESPQFQKMGAAKGEKDSWEHVKNRFNVLRDAAKKLIKDTGASLSGFSKDLVQREKEALLPVLSVLCRLTEDLDSRFSEKKLSRGLMDFSDIEHMALNILRDEKVSSEYRERFAYVFIDEYQDSNMVQEELIRRVAPEGRIFMVGDVKQSIYKFRLAEPELFLGKYKDIKAGRADGRVIDLNANFRSKAGIIDMVNALFSRIMCPESCGILYDEDAALVEGAPYEGSLIYKPKLYITEPAAEDESAEEGAEDEAVRRLKSDEIEALQAVRIIREYLGKPIYDAGIGADRPLTYRDMVILMPTVKGKGETFYRALASAGIPVYLARSEGYFDTLEVSVFLDLLRLIDNSRNDLALISVLHFPSFGFSTEDLAEIRIFASGEDLAAGAKKRRPYSAAFRLYAQKGRDEELRDRCRRVRDRLRLWKKKASYGPLASFVWEVLEDSGIMDLCSALPGGLQRQANLRALADKAAEFEETSAAGLYGFIDRIDAIKGKVSVGEAEVFTADAEAVRIMTIHKSKGLEFPFVLVCGMGEELLKTQHSSSLVIHKAAGAAVDLVDPGTRLRNKTFISRMIREKNRREERAEKIRQLYVAATRAKDILIFSAAGKKLASGWEKTGLSSLGDGYYEKTFLSLLYPAFGTGPTVVLSSFSPQAAGEEQQEDGLRDALKNGFTVDPASLPRGPAQISEILDHEAPEEGTGEKTKYSVSQLAQIQRLGSAAQAARDPESFRPPAFIEPVERLGAAERGTAYHTVMEHIPFTPEGKEPGDISAFIERLVSSSILTPAESRAVDPVRISEFFSSDIGRRVLASPRVMKEAPFTVKRIYEGREIMVQGTLDCCFMEDGSWVLVDYKSNYVDKSKEEDEAERLRNEYIPQLAQYRYALESITGIPVKEAVLYLFGLGKGVTVR